MNIIITVATLASGSGLSRYVFSLCRILKPGNEVLLIETHAKGKSPYTISELAKIDGNIQYIATGGNGKIANYINNIRLLWNFKADVLISNFNGLTQFILPFKRRKTKVLHILHNDAPEFYKIASINGRYVDAWIAPTKGIRDHYNDFTNGKYLNKIKVVAHGVEAPETIPTKGSDTLEITFAGIVDQHKGILIMPDIVRRLTNKGIKFHLTIIGGGGRANWLREELAEEFKAGTITMTGVIEHEKVYDYMSKADIFLYPTHLDAFGLVIAEAMINGAVPIVTLLPGITDNLVADGEYGFLVTRDDVDRFVSHIEQLANNRKMLQDFSRKSRACALDRFSHEVMGRNYRNLIDSL